MSSDPKRPQSWARALPARAQVLIVAVLVFAAGAGVWVAKSRTNSDVRDPDRAALSPTKKGSGVFYPTAAQWSTLTVEPVEQRVQRGDAEFQQPSGSGLDQLAQVVSVARLVFEEREDQQLRAPFFQLPIEHRVVMLHSNILL